MRAPGWRTWVSIQAILSHGTGVSARVVLGYAALDLGAGPAMLGLVAASFAVPSLIGAYPLGRLADSVGGGVVILTGTVVNAAGLLGALWANDSFVALLLCCCALGVGHVACMIGQQTVAAHRTEDSKADSAFGTLSAASSAGQLMGPLVAAAALSAAPGAAVSVDVGVAATLALTTLAAIPAVLLLRYRDAAPPAADTDVSGRHAPPWTILWRSLLVSGIVLAAVDLMYAFMPLWGEEQSHEPGIVGALLAARAGASILSRIGLGRLTARFGRKLVLTVPLAAGAIAFLALPLASLPAAAVLMLAIGVALGVPQPLTVTWLIAGIAHTNRGRLLGWRLASNRFAQSTLPLTVGALSGDAGATAVFSSIGILLAVSAVVAASA